MSKIRSNRFNLYGLVVSGFILLSLALLSASGSANAAGSISQGYEANTNDITQGVLLSLVSNKSNIVQLANSASNSANLVGIAVNKPLLELSGSGKTNIQVVVSGTAVALVSNVNGQIYTGDKIAASPISGIGMKAVKSGEIVGTAQESLSSVNTLKRQISETNGKSLTIEVGLLPIAVNVAFYSSEASNSTVSSFVPPFLQSIANSVSGKQVSPLRVLLGSLALLLGFVAVIVMLYTAVRSGIISIGRNPLAESALRRGLVDIIVAAIGVMVITVVLVYIALSE